MRRQQPLTLLLTALVTTCCLVLLAAAQTLPAGDLAEIESRLRQLESRLQKAEAIRDIKRLQYSYAHYAESGLWLDLGDLFARNGVAHYVQGDFQGPESLRKFYLQELGRGQLGLAEGRIYPHIMIQPVVSVAQDGNTARGRWHVIAMLGSYGASASWAGVAYENRYVLEDGVWKISELSFSSQYSGRYSPPGLTLSRWDLPYHFTVQSAGDPVAAAGSPGVGNGSPGSPSFEDAQQRWVELAQRAQRLQDESDVLNLQHSYGYYFDEKNWDAVANMFSRTGTLELGLRGVYAGKERIRRALSFFSGERLAGDEVSDHLQLATVVHVAEDGKTARARGVELSIHGAKGMAQWEEGIFENGYVRLDGVWKIQSVHYYPRVITDYELGWAKDAKPAETPRAELPPDRPPTETYGIYPKMYYPRFHYANPVTRLPVQYPPGIATGAHEALSLQRYSGLTVPVPARPRTVGEFTARLSELEQLIDSGIAYDAAENLISATGYYRDDEPAEALAIHQTVQPVIEVAADGKSATIRARLLKVGGKNGELGGGTYQGRALNRDGVWRLQGLTLTQEWSSPFTRWAPVVERRRR